MRSQAETEAGFVAAIFDEGAPEGLGTEADARFAVYRNNVQHGLSRALAQRFPVIEALLGAESFLALARVFIAAEPPASPLLYEWGVGLPDFLDRMPALEAHPYLGDVARLEWARGLAWHAADAEPVSGDALSRAASEPETLRLRLHPSLQVLATQHAAYSIWAGHQPGGSLAGIDAMRGEVTLILRDPSDQIVTEALTPGDAAMLEALMRGETLLAAMVAAGHGYDPGPLVMRLVRYGAITGVDGGIEGAAG